MKISFPNGLTIEADTLTDVLALYAIAKESTPNVSVPNTNTPVYKGDPSTFDLRMAYHKAYGARFTMKGRKGNPNNILTALKNAGWPSYGRRVKGVETITLAS